MPDPRQPGPRLAGRWERQESGYRAFIPADLPPDPALELTVALLQRLSAADRALGRLDGIATTLPNPRLFVAMYVRQEAVLSSQIEGTQSTLEDLLAFEAVPSPAEAPGDVAEVVRYVQAMDHGLRRLPDFPLCLRLIREVHGVLMAEGRGSEREPGEFRRSQNWIGPGGCTLRDATFVPPPPHALMGCLGNLENFLHAGESYPALIQAALVHAQFETIHPFLDGNGRVGRLLVTLFLCERGILHQPLLYLSVFLKRHRAEYYDRLTAVRARGDWEGWVDFFLRGVAEVSDQAAQTAAEILALRESARAKVRTPAARDLIEKAFEHPVLSVRAAEGLLGTTFATANKAVDELVEVGLLLEVTGQRRNRRYHFDPYLRLFRGDPADVDTPPPAHTHVP